MSTKSPEFLAFLDDVVERVLLKMCGPAREHFVELNAERVARIARITNGTPAETRQSIRRLAEAGRVTEETRHIGGRTVSGVVCIPIRKRSAQLDWTDEDRAFLRSLRISVDESREGVPAHARAESNAFEILGF